MNKVNYLFISVWLLLSVTHSHSQQAQFNLMVDDDSHNFGTIYTITQDKQGYIWFGSDMRGLTRYNGKEFTEFKNDPENPNSFKGKVVVNINVDSSGMIWISTFGQGLERFDPSTNIFTHYRHNLSDSTSVNSDTLTGMMVDRSGVLWIGSYRGLDRYDKSTGKFTHFNPGALNKGTGNEAPIYELFEDKTGIIWIGRGEPFSGNESYRGGFYRFDRKTEKFTWYGSDPMDPSTLSNINVTAIFEDSKGNFWVGTKGDGLHQFNKDNGKFTRYSYDPKQPEKLSGPPDDKINTDNFISFITEDQKGRIWIGSLFGGINCYDPSTQKIAHFGKVRDNKRDAFFAKDTLSGLKEFGGVRALKTKDGLLWVTGMHKNVYTITYGKTRIPYFPNKNKSSVNSFYLEPNGNILWFGSDDGLVQKDLNTQQTKLWSHDPKNKNSLNNNSVVAIRPDEQGKLWVATHQGGMDQFDPQTGIFTHFKHDSSQPGSIGMDSLHCIFFEDDKYIWVGAEHQLTRMDRRTGLFTTFRHKRTDTGSVSSASVFSFVKDKDGYIWIGTSDGVNRYDHKTEKFKQYLENNSVKNVFIDAKGVLWVGSTQGLLFYEPDKDGFKFYRIPNFPNGIERVLGIIEDNEQNLWLTTNVSIIKINPTRDEAKLYNADYGIQSSSWNWLDNYKAPDGRLFFGGSSGYYMIDPKELNDNRTPPLLNFTNLKIGDKAVLPGEGSVLKKALWYTDKITLPHNQSTFTVQFEAIDFKSSGSINYLYQLENFDKEWRNLGTEHQATFFNISPGSYILHIKAINGEGTMVKKSIEIFIMPPWWKTWWAYIIYGILFVLAAWGIYKYQRNYILKVERERTRERELLQAREIEKAYTELKQTQQLLIQSEKMASLGELTAGIAHEIQNPLNFVNNFSEVNTELIDEMQELLKSGKSSEAITISNDIRENQGKINHHGKRADAIVKGMLQHSRSSSGVKEPTDINVLTDEYLRLAYHGLRAKDKTFNATMKTDFDSSIGMVNVIPQDIGRVILNLFTNAFYTVTEKARQSNLDYKPTVQVTTKKTNGIVEIIVKDNGSGIPQKALDKIFQPFFTTKPTGQGTGLGLSLSYDIIKAHGGELRVETKEGEYAAFVISLPV